MEGAFRVPPYFHALSQHGGALGGSAPEDKRILAQGTNPLPTEKSPGWLIPRSLRDRHTLILAPAEEALPALLARLKSIDVFLHDSDHSYEHIMFEAGLAWRYLRAQACMIIDNIEQNTAFTDFVRGVSAKAMDLASFNGPDRVWRHGLLLKANRDHVPQGFSI